MESIDPIGSLCDITIMGNHDDRITSLAMEYIDEVHDFGGIALIEIACRLISEEIWDIRDKCSCNSYSLLLST